MSILDWFWNLFHPYRATPFELWMCPNIGSDVERLFREPERWAALRERLSVFQLYGGWVTIDSTDHPQWAASRVGPNILPNLVACGMFDKLREWQIPIAFDEVGIVNWDCTGEQPARNFVELLQKIHTFELTAKYVSVSEPFTQAQQCGLSEERAVEITAEHIRGLRRLGIEQVGWVEAYPTNSAQKIVRLMASLAMNEVLPDYLHVDYDWHARPERPAEDFQLLQRACQQAGVTLGVIATYGRAANEQEYGDGVRKVVRRVRGYLGRDPDRWVCQSWWPRGDRPDDDITGVKDLPVNLPETDRNSMTGIALGIAGSR